MYSYFTQATIDPALDSVSVDLIRKYSGKVRDYEAAYVESNTVGKELENAVKKYRSHRKVFSEAKNKVKFMKADSEMTIRIMLPHEA